MIELRQSYQQAQEQKCQKQEQEGVKGRWRHGILAAGIRAGTLRVHMSLRSVKASEIPNHQDRYDLGDRRRGRLDLEPG